MGDGQTEPLLVVPRWNVGVRRKEATVQIFQICRSDTEEQKARNLGKPGAALRLFFLALGTAAHPLVVRVSGFVMGCRDLEMTGRNARVYRASRNRSHLSNSREADCPVWAQEALLQGDNLVYAPLN